MKIDVVGGAAADSRYCCGNAVVVVAAEIESAVAVEICGF